MDTAPATEDIESVLMTPLEVPPSLLSGASAMSKSQTVVIVLAAIGFIYLAKKVGLPIVLACVAGMAWKPHWTWLWSISGALLSVPIVVSIKIVCDRVTAMSSVSELLSQDTSKG